jgi:hypothetical protein
MDKKKNNYSEHSKYTCTVVSDVSYKGNIQCYCIIGF